MLISRLTRYLCEHPFLIFLLSLVVPILGALLSGFVMFGLPQSDAQFLIQFMALTGIVSSILSYTFYRLGVMQTFPSLSWGMVAVSAISILLVFFNVWIIAKFTFVQIHYLSLTSVLLVFAGLAALNFSFFASKDIIDRLRELAKTTQKLAEGNLAIRAKVAGKDEIARLAADFNHMAANLQGVDEEKRQLEQARRDLTAWVSHDLRTPLASMGAMMEAILDGVVQDKETIHRYLRSSRAEIDHLNLLIDDLFELARIDVGHLKVALERASINDLISDTLDSMTIKAEHQGIQLKSEVAEDVDVIWMAPKRVQRVLSNLVDNAIKYTDEGQSVTLHAWQSNGDVRIDIHNSGSYIPRNVLPRLFESFYRGEDSRMRGNDGMRGAGLGLAIARGFVEAHGGRIWATSTESEGTTFSFTLPQTAQNGTVYA